MSKEIRNVYVDWGNYRGERFQGWTIVEVSRLFLGIISKMALTQYKKERFQSCKQALLPF